MSKLSDLAHSVRILELELRKLELDRQIAQVKAEPPIDGECVGCAGPCVVVDVAAKLQKEINTMEKVHANLVLTIEDLTSQLTEKRTIINEITRLRVEEVETRRGRDAELSACKEDSEALAAVVRVVKNWDERSGRAFPTLYEDSTIDDERCVTVKVGFLEL